MLEESRIEGAHIRRRSDDRHWLRASATSLILDDTATATATATTSTASPTPGSGMTRPDAARAAGLLLARVDAGILTDAETDPVAEVAETVLGATDLAQLREIWQAAHRAADDDTDTMLELGRRWCDTVGVPTTPPVSAPASAAGPEGRTTSPTPAGEPPAAGEPPTAPAETPVPGEPGESGESEVPSEMDRAISATLARVAVAVSWAPLPVDPAEAAAAAREEEDKTRAAAERRAGRVFGRGSSWRRSGRTAITGTRPPSVGERAAARQLGRALDTAAVRDRAAIKTTSAMPPGRLRMRGALAADAQRAAGAIPTAQPFTRTLRKITPAPPLRLGVACDVSGSMYEVAAPVASAAWILAHAAHHTRADATTATVIFGHHVRPITRPGELPSQVTEFEAADGTEDIPTAVDALDGALGLSRPGAARLLVVISDGIFTGANTAAGQTRITRLRRSGCAVLWLTPTPHSSPLDGATVDTLTDPTTTARAIGRAAATALRTTR